VIHNTIDRDGFVIGFLGHIFNTTSTPTIIDFSVIALD
jgi:hypothetical protein